MGVFRAALAILERHGVEAVELSALRLEELDPLVEAIPALDLRAFSVVSFHAPSGLGPEREEWVVHTLEPVARAGFPVVVHPDVIYRAERWEGFGDRLLIENMDKRKPGRRVEELRGFFERLPEVGFCFDIGHARQVDPSMTEAAMLVRAFGERMREIHMSEVTTASRHDPISGNAVSAFRQVAVMIPAEVPVILEPLIDVGQSDVETEMRRAREVFGGVVG